MKQLLKEEELIKTEEEEEMINQLLGGLIGMIGEWVNNRQLYSEEQLRTFREMQPHYRDYSSMSMSWYSSSASSTRRQNNLGTSYFDSLEKRLEPEKEEFFKKEEFDVE